MGVFHYKAILIDKCEKEVFYKYLPDFVMLPNVEGSFKFSINDWQPIIISKADPKDGVVVYIDEKCVYSLTHKIKKYFSENKNLPKEIFFIA